MQLHQPLEQVLSAETALKMLKEGNARFMEEHLCDKSSYSVDRAALNEAQKPFAAVICCSDSRVAPEIFFDQKLGDIFVIRNAGNVVDDVVLGSVEYAVEGLQTPLVVVCGHSHCGAVTAACCGGHSLPHLESILSRIHPALLASKDVETVARANVENMVEQIRENSIIREKQAKVVGAYYDIASGEVLWL